MLSSIAHSIICCSRGGQRARLLSAMALPRRSIRLKTKPSASAPLSAVKKDNLGKKKAATKTSAASASAPSMSASRAGKAAGARAPSAARKEKKEAAPAPAPAAARTAPKRSPRPPPKKKGAAKKTGGPTREMEQQLWTEGFGFVLGVDEAGRGPLAGPVVAAAAILPRDGTGLPEGIHLDDSKKMTEEQREEAYEALGRAARNPASTGVAFATCVVNHEVIDEINILEATMFAMDRAVEQLSAQASGDTGSAPRLGGEGTTILNPGRQLAVLVDGNRLPPQLATTGELFGSGTLPSYVKFHARAVVKGDAKCTAIAAASVVAKVTRDRLMREAAARWPRYGFEQHKGYGTAAHVAAIRKYGPCEIHRRSFEPIKSMVGWSRGEGGGEE